MRPALPAVLAAAALAAGCASSDDRLARIEERLDAMDARLAALDERTTPPLTIPLPWRVVVPGAERVPFPITFPPSPVPTPLPSAWRAVLDDGGCVLPQPPLSHWRHVERLPTIELRAPEGAREPAAPR
jgi:hypothetical protein